MIKTWKLPEAKNKLGRVVDNAVNNSIDSLTAFLHDSPLAGVDLDLVRDKSNVREETE